MTEGVTVAGDEGVADVRRRAGRLLFGLGVVSLALLVSHDGEFWPFSIFPMFSRAGRPWARAVVHEVPGALPPREGFDVRPLEQLPGKVLPLEPYGIEQNDLSTLVQREARWTAGERHALDKMLAPIPCRVPLMVAVVKGSLEGAGPSISAQPVAWFTCEGERARLARTRAFVPSR